MTEEPRTALFISHANPLDNEFALWLGAKLGAMGYEVWADVLRLKGGHDWQRELEHALRHRSHKVLLVGTTEGVEKQGVRNELQIATDVGRRINDHNFIVPLKLSDFEKPFVIAHAQYIDFEMSWARGLAELARLLEEENVPRRDNPITETWMDLQLRLSGTVVQSPELLLSNWLEVDGLPAEIVCYDFKAGISIGYAKSKKASLDIPLVSHNRGFITFAGYSELEHAFGGRDPPSPAIARHQIAL